MNKIQQVTDLGQSIWLDYLDRDILDSGEMEQLINQGIQGVTSNPSIFKKAIADGTVYDDAIMEMITFGKSDQEIYEAVAIEDVQRCADLLLPVYTVTNGADGFVSFEVNPNLAHDTEGTIEEARRLYTAVDRPNVMIKVPATFAGIPAITTLISEGININVTLMFALQDYDNVAEAYLRGLEARFAMGEDIKDVASVASFFVSRIDTAVDKHLDQLDNEQDDNTASALKGQTGIANARLAYTRYLNVFSSKRWQQLAAKGARPQRILFGSTSVKNPDYPDTMYADNLVGPNTINTLPLPTVEKFLDHGMVSNSLTTSLDKARLHMVQLARLGIDLDYITQELQDDGVEKFADAFDALLEAIHRFREEQGQKKWRPKPVLEK